MCSCFNSIFILLCVFSQNVDNSYSEINNQHLPYRDTIIVFNISCPKLDALYAKYPELNDSLCPKEDIFTLELENNKISITTNIKVSEFSNDDIKQQITNSKEQIEMLVKYLSGFYYGSLLEGNLVPETVGNITSYTYNYEYKGIKCKNIYKLSNNLLSNALIYQTNSDKADVDIKYYYTLYREKNYLEHFESLNSFHNFSFNLYISYSEHGNYLYPSGFKTTVSQNGKSVEMKYTLYYK